jgi:preprotein translocase subunit Sss1
MNYHDKNETYKPTKEEQWAIVKILAIAIFALIGVLLGVRG